MEVVYGNSADIDMWMELVENVSWNFPGVETPEKLQEMWSCIKAFATSSERIES